MAIPPSSKEGKDMSFADVCAFLLVLIAFGTLIVGVIEARRDK
ncbi:hypothetical protein [Sphingomonas gilva]|nr:hypothetical protein [Sphingomonas gilva]